MDRPSYGLRPGDVVAIADRSKAKQPFQVAASGGHAPGYLDVSLANLVCRVARPSVRAEIPVVCEERLVVEYYSR
ncbi:small subunit ribosomal protein S4 [Modestobacter sp. DSM 44400]|nr:small subunit ribosomal protein S4 [Modestobacter sp. DSM 44400]